MTAALVEQQKRRLYVTFSSCSWWREVYQKKCWERKTEGFLREVAVPLNQEGVSHCIWDSSICKANVWCLQKPGLQCTKPTSYSNVNASKVKILDCRKGLYNVDTDFNKNGNGTGYDYKKQEELEVGNVRRIDREEKEVLACISSTMRYPS